MTFIAMVMLALAGFAALMAAMAKHHRDLWGAAPSTARKRALAAAGRLLLAASAALAVVTRDILVGACLWLGVAMLAVLAVAMAVTYAPRPRRRP